MGALTKLRAQRTGVRRALSLAIAVACLAALATLGPWLLASALGQRGVSSRPSRYDITYTAWNGRRRIAVVLLPAWYKHGSARRLPLVISPHGRGMSPAFVASRWGALPTHDGFAVVCPAGEGARLPADSWGATGEISDLARMPQIVGHALPWVHIDRRCVYAVGASMGGQEALLLAARHPDRIAAAVSIDGVADLATHFDEMPRPRGPGRRILAEMVVECGGTPAQRPAAYALRSPLCYAHDLAFDHVPLELWWSRRDQVVVNQGACQSGLLYRTIKGLNPEAPVRQVVTDYRHCVAFCSAIALRQVVCFLRPGGRWRQLRAPPRLTFTVHRELDWLAGREGGHTGRAYVDVRASAKVTAFPCSSAECRHRVIKVQAADLSTAQLSIWSAGKARS